MKTAYSMKYHPCCKPCISPWCQIIGTALSWWYSSCKGFLTRMICIIQINLNNWTQESWTVGLIYFQIRTNVVSQNPSTTAQVYMSVIYKLDTSFIKAGTRALAIISSKPLLCHCWYVWRTRYVDICFSSAVIYQLKIMKSSRVRLKVTCVFLATIDLPGI